jgi:hypothetical protein
LILNSLIYLFSFYWPYVLGALVIGLGTGWFGLSRK